MRTGPSETRATAQRRAGSPHPSRSAAGAGCAALALLLLLASGVAWAHGEESDEAPVLVEQAIGLIANDAGEAQVAERIEDALQAPHKEGADLDTVRRALEVVERPGESAPALQQTRVLLLNAIGGKLPSAPQSGRLATGTETGTSTVLDEFRPTRGIADGGDAVLLSLALAAVVVGLWLSHRLRPPHTIRALEHRVGKEQR